MSPVNHFFTDLDVFLKFKCMYVKQDLHTDTVFNFLANEKYYN